MREKRRFFVLLGAMLALLIFMSAGCGDDNPVTSISPVGPTGPTGAPGPDGPLNTASLTVSIFPDTAEAVVTITRILEGSISEDIISSDSSGNGQFIFTNLTAGTYRVNCTASGYGTQIKDVDVSEGAQETLTFNLEETQVGITKIEPKVCVNGVDMSQIPITIRGSDFSGTCSISLVPVSGGDPRTADGNIVDSQTVTCVFNLTDIENGEYTLTVTHTPFSSSSTEVSTSFWIMSDIQATIDKAAGLYVAQLGSSQALGDVSDQVMAYVPPGTYYEGDDSFNPRGTLSGSQASYAPLIMKSGVYLKGAGNGGEDLTPSGTYTMIDLQDNPYDRGGILYMDQAYNLTVDSFRLTGGNARERGGAILCRYPGQNVTFSNNTIIENHSDWGGGIQVEYVGEYTPCNLLIENNTIRDNYANIYGGIYIRYIYSESQFTIKNNKIMNNYSLTDDAGGMMLYDFYSGSTGIVTGNTITHNGSRVDRGGGIAFLGLNEPGISITVSENTITENYARYGGGIDIPGQSYPSSTVNIVNNTISENGGELLNFNIGGTDYDFLHTERGGGIFFDGYVTVEGNTITDNMAIGTSGSTSDGLGGGLYFYDSEGFTLQNNTVTGNDADQGGGLYIGELPGSDITGNTFTGNNARDAGGGIFLGYWQTACPYGIHNNTISGNTNIDSGGSPAGNDGVQLLNSYPADIVDATNNDWGTPVGSLTDTDVFRIEGATPNVIVQ